MLIYLKELYKYRSLLWIFVYRDIKARYKQTSIGIAWAVIQPLFLMFVFSLVFSYFFKVNTGGIPYPVFSYIALLPWTFISRSIISSGVQFLGQRALVTRVYFPREIIPLTTVFSALVDFIIGSLVFIIMLIVYKISLSSAAWFIILILPIQIVLACALSLLATALMILFRDMQFAMPLLTQLWMYASPIIYSVHNLQPRFKIYFYFNPVTGIIEGLRDCVVKSQVPDIGLLISSAIFSIMLFIFAYWFFKKLEYFLVDIL